MLIFPFLKNLMDFFQKPATKFISPPLFGARQVSAFDSKTSASFFWCTGGWKASWVLLFYIKHTHFLFFEYKNYWPLQSCFLPVRLFALFLCFSYIWRSSWEGIKTYFMITCSRLLLRPPSSVLLHRYTNSINASQREAEHTRTSCN